MSSQRSALVRQGTMALRALIQRLPSACSTCASSLVHSELLCMVVLRGLDVAFKVDRSRGTRFRPRDPFEGTHGATSTKQMASRAARDSGAVVGPSLQERFLGCFRRAVGGFRRVVMRPLGCLLRASGASWGPLGGGFGAPLIFFWEGAEISKFEVVFLLGAPSWGVVELFVWAVCEASWTILEVSWAVSAPTWVPLRSYSGDTRGSLNRFGSSGNRKKLHIRQCQKENIVVRFFGFSWECSCRLLGCFGSV